jgi:signal peptidase I
VDFALILFIALILTGIVSLWDRLMGFRKLANRARIDGSRASDRERLPGKENSALSIIVEYARAFFPVILLVFILRSFVIEPFRIPSGSMLPTLYIGDFILVDKFRYGIRLPIINVKAFPVGSPKRGEVMVFRYPHDQSTNFIKRVIGLPGDEIVYDQKRLFINGTATERVKLDSYKLATSNQSLEVIEYSEAIGESAYNILNDSGRTSRSMTISVPEGSYFVMGDNRDHSNDSRFWGFVPEENIVGRAFLIWFSWNSNDGGVNWSRIGHSIP